MPVSTSPSSAPPSVQAATRARRSKESKILHNQYSEVLRQVQGCCPTLRRSGPAQAQCLRQSPAKRLELSAWRTPRYFPSCWHKRFGIRPQDRSEIPKARPSGSLLRLRFLSSSTYAICWQTQLG